MIQGLWIDGADARDDDEQFFGHNIRCVQTHTPMHTNTHTNGHLHCIWFYFTIHYDKHICTDTHTHTEWETESEKVTARTIGRESREREREIQLSRFVWIL